MTPPLLPPTGNDPRFNVPPVTVVPPVQEMLPLSVSVPVPAFTMPMVPPFAMLLSRISPE